MAVQDDVRRLSQMDSIFLGVTTGIITAWYKERVQQANGVQLGHVGQGWSSSEGPTTVLLLR